MYINGRKITLAELEQLADNLISSLIDDLYNEVLRDGVEQHIPGGKIKRMATLTKMMNHYVEREEYEKCAKLRDMI
tara:strand:+ start:816 stop:1043 length:228 start_codon:yes stop_codon:yes gene_type:complete